MRRRALPARRARPTVLSAPSAYRLEASDAAERAMEAGAESPLKWAGIGMTSVVLCGAEYHAWKAARRPEDPLHYRLLEDEADWLHAARGLKHVPELYRFHQDQVVIERECVWGKEASWPRGHDLFLIYESLREPMLERGWTMPEYKQDSFVKSDHGWVLVDCGFAQRVGVVLLRYVLECLEGLRREPPPVNDLAYYLYREVGMKTLTAAQVQPVLDRLRAAGATEWTELP